MTEMIATPPVSPQQFNSKRVSFGDNPVKTFLYEQESEEVTPIINKQPFTDPSAPVARVQVTAEETVEVPSVQIPPPSQLDDFRKGAASPPLPWVRKMESEHENPFRPQEDLYHEVDPIVEAYLHKPFPNSQPGSANATPVKTNGSSVSADGRGAAANSPGYLQNGLSKEQLLQAEKAALQQPLLQQDSPHKRSSRDPSVPVSEDAEMPAPGQIELVHIKKKKCGCCSLQ